MINFIDPDHPFYRPLWIRILIVAICCSWTVVEFWHNETTWGMIVLALSTYTACVLLIFFKPKPVPTDQTKVDEPT